MKNRDLIGSLFWLVVGVVFSVGALKYGLIHFKIPGAGFLPFLAGSALIFLSLITLFSSVRMKGGGIKAGSDGYFFLDKDSKKKIFLGLCSLFIYALALQYLGFLLTTFLFMLFLLKFIEPEGWISSFIVASVTAISFYIIFYIWLQIQFPKGFWE